MSPKIRAVLFDAGNTLVFPRIEEVVRQLTELGYAATPEDFYEAERIGKRKLDDWLWPLLRRGDIPRSADYYYWTAYLHALAVRVGVPEEKRYAVSSEIAGSFKQISIWSRVLPETPACLEALRNHGFLLGVVSNSLGLIEAQLRSVGLAGHFQFILDSHYVGVEKPHPEIFQLAIERCGCLASEAVFVGDLYSTDVGGAQSAGLHGVLMDCVGAYPEAAVPRITSLKDLGPVLAALQNHQH
ncbi:MAG TPA: HAD family hydrolase [Terriglobia bacterium]|nr:HAD family hydrolase [Terriglobia bacterium]